MRYRLYLQSIAYLAVAIAFALFQAGFISSLPGQLPQADPVLIFLLFVLVLSDLKSALLFALLIGFFLDSLSFAPFGIYGVSLLLSVLASFFLLTSFLTNRSLYSFLALTAFATAALWLFKRLADFAFSALAGESVHFMLGGPGLTALFFKLVLNSILVIVSFQLVNFVTHKLKPVFLFK